MNDLLVTEAEAASTGAAADAAEADERLKALPRILRIAMLHDRDCGLLTERLVGEIAEVCPGLPQTAAWAASSSVDSALLLAAELDRRAVAEDRSDLRSLADCVRLISLPVPSNDEMAREHKRVAKTLLAACRNLPKAIEPELSAEIEGIVWGWAALPAALNELIAFGSQLALSHVDSVGERMAWRRIELAESRIRQQHEDQARERRDKQEKADRLTAGYKGSAVTNESLVVCCVDDATMKNPKMKEIIGPFKHAINAPLPLVAAPPLHETRKTLLFEFPYAESVVDFCLADLVGRSTVRIRPLLLVGPPGGGKSRFGRRLGEVLGINVWRVDASRSDGAVFGGTDKRWYSAEPCHPFLAVAQARSANPLVLIDEIEKAGTRTDYGRLWDCVLGFLESETAARYPDPALQVPLDLSAVNYVATANSIDQLPPPIRDRFRVIEFPKPRAADLEALLPAVIADLAAERGLDPRFIPTLNQDDHHAARRVWKGGSVRRLRRVVEAIINAKERWAIKH